jgi:hypothetical protein
MTPEDVKTLVLTLPEAAIGDHFGKTAFRAGKKLFATMSADGVVSLQVPRGEFREALLADRPEVFLPDPRYGSQGVIGVRVAGVEPELMRDLLTDSWACVATKRAQKVLAERLGQG